MIRRTMRTIVRMVCARVQGNEMSFSSTDSTCFTNLPPNTSRNPQERDLGYHDQ